MISQVKVCITLLFCLASLNVLGADRIKQAGNWSLAASWVDGTPPAANDPTNDIDTKTTGSPKLGNGDVSTVNGNYTVGNMTFSDQTLTISSGNTLNLGNQTLFDAATYKNFTATNNTTINVPSGATMIIYGDLSVDNGLTLNIAGTFIVKGNITMANGGTLAVTGSGSVDVGGNLSGGNNTSISTSGTATIAVGGSLSTGGGTSSISGPTGSISVGTTCDVGGAACPDTVLPIELIYFTAKSEGRQIQLEWATASELNNDYFTIERSTDGRKYEEIGRLSGAGNSIEIISYHFIDKAPVYGKSFYRLKQTDFDGAFEVFNPALVYFTSLDENNIHFTNPVSPGEQVTIYTDSDEKEVLTLSIINMLGQTVVEKTFSGISHTFQLGSNVKTGVYLLKVASLSTEKTGRLIVN